MVVSFCTISLNDYELVMILSMLEAMRKEDVHVLNFKGFMPGKITFHKWAKGHADPYGDYFADNLKFLECYFCLHFLMNTLVLLHIVEGVKEYDNYSCQRQVLPGYLGFSLKKCVAAMRMFTYDTTTDDVDEYVWTAESTCNEAMVGFSTTMVRCLEKSN